MKHQKLNNTLNTIFEGLLNVNDYCENGLQVPNSNREVKKILFAVTCSKDVILEAQRINADTIIVHHGIFWKHSPNKLEGITANRVKLLNENNIALYAYHLPLDQHKTMGNNVLMAKLLGLNVDNVVHNKKGVLICNTNSLSNLHNKVLNNFNPNIVRHITSKDKQYKDQVKVGLCTGGAQSLLEFTKLNDDIDVYITGENSEYSFHEAKEYGVNFYSVGHNDSEEFGVKALCSCFSEDYETIFFREDNPF